MVRVGAMDEQRGESERDLGALLARVLPRLMSLETPILQEAGLSMWEYAIISELAAGAAVSQVELSTRTGRDVTRLGKHLDELAARRLVDRERGPDQRQRTVRVTDAGRRVWTTARRAIRAAEDDYLHAVLAKDDARRLRALLSRLADAE